MGIGLKRIALYLFISTFFFNILVLEVSALEVDGINSEVLNSYSDTISFMNDSIAVVKGSLRNDLLLSDIISQIKVDDLQALYGIDSITVIGDNGNVLSNESIITSGMKLVFSNEVNDYVYDIMIVGDINNDGIVNNYDVTSMVDDILNNGFANVINDVNNDGLFDVYDVTHTIYSVTNNTWVNDDVVSDMLSSSINSSSNVYVGDELVVTYTINGFNRDSINGIEGILNYDTNFLELVSTNIDSQYGYINSSNKFLYILDNYSNNKVLLTFRFRVLKDGESTISIDGIKASMNGLVLNIDNNIVSTTVKVNNYGIGGDFSSDREEANNSNIIIEYPDNTSNEVVTKSVVSYVNKVIPAVDNSENNNTINYVNISNDNYIKELTIKNYKINFDKDTLEYSIAVSNKVNSLNLDVILNDDKASYEVIGNENFKTGRNIVSIVVTAEDGSTKTYTINVNKEKAKTIDKKNEKTSNSSRVVIIILIILVIIGLIYVIFKDDEEEENENKKKESKE